MTEESMRGLPVGQNAIVFAPHADDETLGCGGTIIKKRAAGNAVHIIVMTDGSRSHLGLIEPFALASMRREEAIRAWDLLGVDADEFSFLEFPDGSLGRHREEAEDRVRSILNALKPDEIFLPYRRDVNPDHVATNGIVRRTLRDTGQNPTIYEYPVWFWGRWPWLSLPRRSSDRRRKNFLAATEGIRDLLFDLRVRVYVGDVLHAKRAALEQYRSQMTHIGGRAEWKTLHEVAGGEFLSFLLTDYERFYRYRAI